MRRDSLLSELNELTATYSLLGIALRSMKKENFNSDKEFDTEYMRLISEQNNVSTKLHATRIKIDNLKNKRPEYGFEIVDVSVRRYLP